MKDNQNYRDQLLAKQPVYKSPVQVDLDEDLRGKQERFEMAPGMKKRGSNGPDKERI